MHIGMKKIRSMCDSAIPLWGIYEKGNEKRSLKRHRHSYVYYSITPQEPRYENKLTIDREVELRRTSN